jgi:uncharacterized protein YjbJ (UPF0337 family)
MGDDRDEGQDERPATWENEVVGEAKEVLGRAIGDKALVEEGEEQVEIAHEVRDEYEDHEKAGPQPGSSPKHTDQSHADEQPRTEIEH